MSIFLISLLFIDLNLQMMASHDQFVYSGFADSNIILDGVAIITPDDGLVDLTNAHERFVGHMFYPTPLRFRKSPSALVQSFSVSFAFGVHPHLSAQPSLCIFHCKEHAFLIRHRSPILWRIQRRQSFTVDYLQWPTINGPEPINYRISPKKNCLQRCPLQPPLISRFLLLALGSKF
jgi:hypothetical protein